MNFYAFSLAKIAVLALRPLKISLIPDDPQAGVYLAFLLSEAENELALPSMLKTLQISIAKNVFV